MAIPIVLETEEIRREFPNLQEPCCFCWTPTPYWNKRRGVPVCQSCAPKHHAWEIPTKKRWLEACDLRAKGIPMTTTAADPIDPETTALMTELEDLLGVKGPAAVFRESLKLAKAAAAEARKNSNDAGELQVFTIRYGISRRQLADQLVTAVEGAITYWATDALLIVPEQSTLKDLWYDDESLFRGDFKIKVIQRQEHKPGAGLDLYLTHENVVSGLTVMEEKFPEQLLNIRTGNGDADTADIFIQCALFGELVYG